MNQLDLELSLKEITCIAPSINGIPLVQAAITGAIESMQQYSKVSKDAGMPVISEAADEAVAFFNSWMKALESVRQEHVREFHMLMQARQQAEAGGGLAMNVFQDKSDEEEVPEEDAT
jgi:hypothetical protein